jgi:BirA family biotin operon repressor/biotin-[acetyl-CoA-carboxylase] ligase
MAFALGPKALAAGYRLATYDTTGSTSTEALAWGTLGDPGRLWIVAGEQTAGHGRRGRAWQTPRGNLAASLLIVRPEKCTKSATLGFAAGLALESAIRACGPTIGVRIGLDAASGDDVRLALKWPYDVLLDGAKIAGILLEAVTRQGAHTNVVIGIGVNVRHAPEGIPYPVTSLAECGAKLDAETLFSALAEAWVDQESLWAEGSGFPAIRDHWLQRAAGLGAPIAVRIGEDVLSGTFETIDDDGRLIVRAGDGSSHAVSAGEVHFGAAATAVH